MFYREFIELASILREGGGRREGVWLMGKNFKSCLHFLCESAALIRSDNLNKNSQLSYRGIRKLLGSEGTLKII